MNTQETKIGRITVEFEIANNQDLTRAKHGNIDVSAVRRMTIRGVVDSATMRMVLPLAVANELGLPIKKTKVRVKCLGGRPSLRAEVDEALLGRDGTFNAIVEPKRETALIGAIVLEDLDLLVDCAKLCLVPRDPDFVVSEIE